MATIDCVEDELRWLFSLELFESSAVETFDACG